jgi:BNR repeat-like domain
MSAKTRPHVRTLYQSICLLVLLLVTQYANREAVPTVAQSAAVTWSRPVNLSNTLQGSGDPAIVADSYGNVHVFWSEDMGGQPQGAEGQFSGGNSIFYTRWDGESWTAPIDILSVPDDYIADFVQVVVDAENRLHAVWTGQSSLYYSSAPAEMAYSARAWSKPVVLANNSARSAWMISIVADTAGTLHVAYATRGSEVGVYYTRSTDGGMDWGFPIKLSAVPDSLEDSFSDVRIVADSTGRLHVVWQTNQKAGYGQAIYYARSPDGGRNWGPPVRLGYREPDDFDVGYPYLVVRGESELHLIYNAGSRPVGRYHRISRDGGETWGNPEQILTDMEGINGYVVPLVDGAGQMHLIIDMRTRDSQVVGLYYARWLETGWSPVVPLATESPYGPSAHYTAAAVRLGNELHVVWTQLRFGEIWYLRGTVPGVTPEPTLERPFPATPTPSSFTASSLSQSPMPTSQPTAQPVDAAIPASASRLTNNLVVYSLGVPFLLVLGVILGALIRARRRS